MILLCVNKVRYVENGNMMGKHPGRKNIQIAYTYLKPFKNKFVIIYVYFKYKWYLYAANDL